MFSSKTVVQLHPLVHIHYLNGSMLTRLFGEHSMICPVSPGVLQCPKESLDVNC